MTVDLTTNYLGLKLRNPLVVAACPLTAELDVLRQLEEAGADPNVTAQQIESQYVALVSAVKNTISIPLAVKVSPFFTAFANVAQKLTAAGADGLVLFNRFLQPDIDVDTLRVSPHLMLSH